MRVGLVGVGPWGKKIARTICEDIPGLRLHRATTRNPEARQFVGALCSLHTDWREMLACNDLDAILLAVPATLNREIAGVALAKRIPVFIEKPMALNSIDAREIYNLAVQHNCTAEVDHLDLHNPAICAMREEIHKPIDRIFGRIGAPYLRRADMDPYWEYSPHFLALTIELMRAMPVAVRAKYLPIAVEPLNDPGREIVQIVLNFNNGSDVCIEAGNGMTKKVRTMDVYLEEEVFHFADRAAVPLSRSPASAIALDVPIPVPITTLPLTAALRSFESKLRNGTPDVSGVVMGLKVVTILESVAESLLTGDWCAIGWTA